MKTKYYNYLLAFFLLFAAQMGFSQTQRIVGYFPKYAYNATNVTQVQYAKLTHVIFFSLSPMAEDGAINTGTTTWFDLPAFNAMVDNAKAVNPNIKIIIATGGAPGGGDGGDNGGDLHLRLRKIAANSSGTNRMAFVNGIGNFIQTYSRTVGGVTYTIDGWDFDWEFPNYLNTNAADTTNFRVLLGLMRTRLNTAGTALCKRIEMSAAVNGEPSRFHTNPATVDYLTPGAINYLDFVNIMSYDANLAAHTNYGGNHSPLIMAQEAVNALTSPPFNWPKSKLLIGIAFYGRTNTGATPTAYSTINASNSGAIYSGDISGGQYYNGCNIITSKVNYSKTQGLGGVFFWELTQDRLATPAASATNSLLSCTYSAVGTSIWTPSDRTCCREPDLGNDKASCNTAFNITLNSGTPTASNVTFTWKRILPSVTAITTGSSTANTQVIDNSAGQGAGTYVVIRDSAATGYVCRRSDTIVINSALPSPVFSPSTVSLCASSYFLTPTNVSAFPAGTTFQWQFNGVNISGATSSSHYATNPGAYKLIATLTGCVTTEATVTLTAGASSAVPVDACRTTTGTLTLGVSGGTGPFNWYSQDSPYGSILSGGSNTSTYTTGSLTTGTYYYYVEDEGALGTSYSVGIPTSGVCGGCAQYANPAGTALATSVGMAFTVTNQIRIRSIDLYAWGGSTYPFTYRIEIFNTNFNTVYTSPNIVVTVSGMRTETLNATLDPGYYAMRAVVVSGGATAPAFLHEAASTFPYTGADISLTSERQVAQYGPFLNWQISNVSACKRIKVRAVVAASCDGFLPVDLLYFNAEKSENSVLLDWATSSETDNDYFIVERSLDGINYTTIETVPSSGNSTSLQRYRLVDSDAPRGMLYYRLVQVDLNGEASMSEIKVVDNTNGFELTIAPNPFANSTIVKIKGAPSPVDLRIYDVNGKLIQSLPYTDVNGEINIGSSLSPGFYILEAVSSSSITQHKFIKE